MLHNKKMSISVFISSLCFSCLIFDSSSSSITNSNRTFSIDYQHDRFLKDGQPFRYIAGTLHYFQIPRELWRDRMLRVRALGCNALQTYILWSRHEPQPGKFTFDDHDDANLTEYFRLASELGFVVILRIGPYIDAEMDFGGLPYWLLKSDLKNNNNLRSSLDDNYLEAVRRWMNQLLPRVHKWLYANGGPVITVQLENEYGSFPACDKAYTSWLYILARRHLGDKVVLFTTDGADFEQLNCGRIDNTMTTIDFGTAGELDVAKHFALLRLFYQKGPLINSEFYPGWLDKWGNVKHAVTPASDVIQTMNLMWRWSQATSFTIYPAHGGTNWGYQAGSLAGPPFQGVTTGYDFDAPISEAGDTTQKFLDMRKAIESLTGRTIDDPIPESPKKYAYGKIRLESMGTVLDLLNSLTDPNRIVRSTYPKTMEELDQAYGFVVYQSILPKNLGRLEVTGVRDRAYVIVNGRLKSVIQRGAARPGPRAIRLGSPNDQDQGQEMVLLHILVENQGRLCYGPVMNDSKGLLENVTLDGRLVTNWTMYPLDLDRVHKLERQEIRRSIEQNLNDQHSDQDSSNYLPSIYYGYFFADPIGGDTFFDPSGWGKGQLFVNGRNIGRYWPTAGPQITLYVPGVYLSSWQQFNQVYLFELDQPGACESEQQFGCWARFVDQPKYNR